MKKNKTIAYMLAVTLLVGGTFVGTKALFTDKVDTVGELSISTGDVDIDTEVIQDWTLVRNGNEPNNGTSVGGNIAQFDNLKTGDVLTKKVKVTNKGTLKAVVTFEEVESITQALPKGIDYVATFKTESGQDIVNNSVMNIDESGIVEFKIEVTGGGQHNQDDSLNSDNQEETIIKLNESYKLEAKQIEKK